MKVVVLLLACSLSGCGLKVMKKTTYEVSLLVAYEYGIKTGVNLPISKCHIVNTFSVMPKGAK